MNIGQHNVLMKWVFFILKRFLQNEIPYSGRFLVLVVEVTLEKAVPLGHTVDLMLVVALTGALRQVTLGPLAVASGQLLDADGWVLTVVTVDILGITSLTLGATMGELVLIVETTSLVATFEVAAHTLGIGGELGNPCVLGWEEGEPIVQDLVGELGQTIKTVKGVTRWDLLVIGGGDGKQKCW